MKAKPADIAIDGQGFYTLTACTRRGHQFMKRVQGSERGTAYCESTQLAQHIADSALRRGLRVDVNGKALKKPC